jgi:hypothetical protein
LWREEYRMLATTLAVSAWSPFVTMTLLPYWLHSFREIPFFLCFFVWCSSSVYEILEPFA